MHPEPEIPYHVISETLADFRKLLDENGIVILSNSRLQQTMAAASDLVAGRINDASLDYRDHLRRLFGAFYVISKILRICKHPEFGDLVPHLKKLAKTEFVQSAPASILDRDADKMIEIAIGAACLHFCHKVTLDDPDKSSGGNNPDVIARFNDRSFGIACKTPHSSNAKSIFDSFETGLRQLDRASTDFGFVLINLKNVMPHDVVWPLAGTREYQGVQIPQYRSGNGKLISDAVNEYLGTHMLAFLSTAFSGRPPEEIMPDHKVPPCLVFFLQFMTSVETKPSLIVWLYGIQIVKVPPETAQFIDALNKSLQLHAP